MFLCFKVINGFEIFYCFIGRFCVDIPVQEKIFGDVQADFVTELSVRIGEEVFGTDIVNKGVVIENPMSINFVKEGRFYLWVGQQ